MNNLIRISLDKLKKNNIPNPELDLRIILNNSSKKNKEIIFSNFDINDIDLKIFDKLLIKRLNREPISKILNKKYFWKNEFFVNSRVLDPRPESELIIEETLKIYKNKNEALKILDIGTGSGCLSISLANEYNNANITAIDVSKSAINVAKKNIKKNNFEKKIKLKLMHFYKIRKKFDLIVSNPPYLSQQKYDKCQIEIKKFEPKLALVGGKDGLKFYRIFARFLEKIMNRGSYFICEIGDDQLDSCIRIFKNSKLSIKNIRKDLQNIDRTLIFSKI